MGSGRDESPPPGRATLAEVAGSFLRLGTIGFGGPAAHLALMRSELVIRRGWVSEQELLDLIGGASLLPGPSSTQVALMLARRRKGWAGLVVGGICFIVPAVLLVLVLSWAYVRYGSTTIGEGVLYGIKPVVVAIIAVAIVGLSRTALRHLLLGLVAASALAGYLLGVGPLVLLLGAGALVAIVENRGRTGPRPAGTVALVLVALGRPPRGEPSAGGVASPGLWAIFLEFLKLGSVVFGSGYVLFAYLRHDLVATHYWLTETQLLATVAIGQLTPGPVFTTATSVGYVVGGIPGALVATVGIFLPSFVFVVAFLPVLSRARRSPWGASALDGVNAAAVALMAGVTIQLARSSYVSWVTLVTGVIALALLWRWRVNSVWLILGGALVGIVHSLA